MSEMLRVGLQITICVSAMLSPGLCEIAEAYESDTVTNGATVRGKVTFSGTAPDPKVFELRRYYYREYCAALSDGKGHRLLKGVWGRRADSRMSWWSSRGSRRASPLRSPMLK